MSENYEISMSPEQLQRAKDVIASGKAPEGWQFHADHMDAQFDEEGFGMLDHVKRPDDCIVCQDILERQGK